MDNRFQNQTPREVDRLTQEVNSWWGRTFVYVRKTRVKTWKGVFIVAFISGVVGATIWMVSMDIKTNSRASVSPEFNYAYNYTPTPEMELMKKSGCVADGLLSGYGGDTDNSIALIERSQCRYLHRAIETWAAPPDFDQIAANLAKFKRNDYIFGMFLAEAINPKAKYYYPDEDRNFKFSKMCKSGTDDTWGPNTCKANLGSEEYQKYLRYITQRAIDLNIKTFLLGQVYFQENADQTGAARVVAEMRSYAASRGKKIIIGAQTNTISDAKYLKMFDYIEGGVGQDENGNLEKNACLSKYSANGGWCWALLWNQEYAKKANNLILHLDWNGSANDDMSIFARMDAKTRAKTLEKFYNFFTKKDIGFLMPFLAVIDKENSSCYGSQKGFYSPDNKYLCRDEDAINSILKKGKLSEEKVNQNNARFISQDVPAEMIAGEEYSVSVIFENSGTNPWSREMGYRLGSQNPQDNDFFGGRVNLESKEIIRPGEKKISFFKVKAPEEPGVYNFQWRMLQEKVEWFGDLTKNQEIIVKKKAD